MSSSILGETRNPLSNKAVKLAIMPKSNEHTETLGEMVRRLREGRNLSTKAVERASRAGGMKGLSDGYVSALENGNVPNPSIRILNALARGLGLGRTLTDELFAVARGVKPPEAFSESWFHELFEQYRNLVQTRHIAEIDEKVQKLLHMINNHLKDIESVASVYEKKNADSPSELGHIRKK